MKINAGTQALAQSLAEQIGRMSDSEAEGPEAGAIRRRLIDLVGQTQADELTEAASNDAGLTAAARALRAIPSKARSEQSRRNGIKGGRPARYVLVDDLGRCVGDTITRAGQAGARVEYGWRGDGILRVEGIATLVRPSDWDGYTPERRYDC